jgi:branched-chain amino acid transport system ATP-binding protein
MLDEPAAGLNPKETEDLKALISVLREEHNVTVLLIEHDMKLVMSISDHIVVINQGTPLADGTPEQIRDNPEVIKAYLGKRKCCSSKTFPPSTARSRPCTASTWKSVRARSSP